MNNSCGVDNNQFSRVRLIDLMQIPANDLMRVYALLEHLDNYSPYVAQCVIKSLARYQKAA